MKSDGEILSVARKLREAGRLEEAIALAERGLKKKGDVAYELALWLAPLEESQGRKEMALLAYRAAYDSQPEIELYRHIKRLSGTNWENIRPALLKKARELFYSDILVDIHLEEGAWDAAIKEAQKDIFAHHLLEKVADALIPHRTDWVIRTSIKQAEDLIAQTQSKLYPVAARWLGRAKKGYQHKGQNGGRLILKIYARYTQNARRCRGRLKDCRESLFDSFKLLTSLMLECQQPGARTGRIRAHPNPYQVCLAICRNEI